MNLIIILLSVMIAISSVLAMKSLIEVISNAIELNKMKVGDEDEISLTN